MSLKSIEVIDYAASEEGAAIFQCRFIDDYLRPFCFDSFHDALDGRLAEVVRIRLHGEAIDTDCD